MGHGPHRPYMSRREFLRRSGAVSALTVVAVRPTIRRHQLSASESGDQPFGVEAIEGSAAVVLEQVDAGAGMVKIDGELWSARAYDGTQVLAPGERVRVIEVRGATAMVWRDEFAAPGELPGTGAGS